jgi:hypothetical protein
VAPGHKKGAVLACAPRPAPFAINEQASPSTMVSQRSLQHFAAADGSAIGVEEPGFLARTARGTGMQIQVSKM